MARENSSLLPHRHLQQVGSLQGRNPVVRAVSGSMLCINTNVSFTATIPLMLLSTCLYRQVGDRWLGVNKAPSCLSHMPPSPSPFLRAMEANVLPCFSTAVYAATLLRPAGTCNGWSCVVILHRKLRLRPLHTAFIHCTVHMIKGLYPFPRPQATEAEVPPWQSCRWIRRCHLLLPQPRHYFAVQKSGVDGQRAFGKCTGVHVHTAHECSCRTRQNHGGRRRNRAGFPNPVEVELGGGSSWKVGATLKKRRGHEGGALGVRS